MPDVISAALDAVAAETPAEAPPEAAAANDNAAPDGEVGGDEQQAETEGSEKGAPAPAEPDPFAAEQLATPDGITKARALIESERSKQFRKARELDGRDIRLKDKEKKFNHRVETENQRMSQDRLFVQDVRNTVQLFRTGTARQRLEALGRLAGQPGTKAYEELSHGILSDGKPREVSPEVAELKGQLDQLVGIIRQQEQQRQQREAALEQHQQRAFVEQRKQELVTAASNAEVYPNLARHAQLKPAEVAAYAVTIKEQHLQQTGDALDDAETLGIIERELTQALGQRAAKPTSSGPPQKPGGNQALSLPGHKAIPPSLAARSGGAVRELTDDERLDELSRDPEFLALLGG